MEFTASSGCTTMLPRAVGAPTVRASALLRLYHHAKGGGGGGGRRGFNRNDQHRSHDGGRSSYEPTTSTPFRIKVRRVTAGAGNVPHARLDCVCG